MPTHNLERRMSQVASEGARGSKKMDSAFRMTAVPITYCFRILLWRTIPDTGDIAVRPTYCSPAIKPSSNDVILNSALMSASNAGTAPLSKLTMIWSTKRPMKMNERARRDFLVDSLP